MGAGKEQRRAAADLRAQGVQGGSIMGRGLPAYFMLPATATRGAPRSLRRAASSALCARHRSKYERTWAMVLGRRFQRAALLAERRPFTMANGIWRCLMAERLLGQSSDSTHKTASGSQHSKFGNPRRMVIRRVLVDEARKFRAACHARRRHGHGGDEAGKVRVLFKNGLRERQDGTHLPDAGGVDPHKLARRAGNGGDAAPFPQMRCLFVSAHRPHPKDEAQQRHKRTDKQAVKGGFIPAYKRRIGLKVKENCVYRCPFVGVAPRPRGLLLNRPPWPVRMLWPEGLNACSLAAE